MTAGRPVTTVTCKWNVAEGDASDDPSRRAVDTYSEKKRLHICLYAIDAPTRTT
jgi:hypothetical protein